MNKNLTYKTKIQLEDMTTKTNKIKMELVITSNHNLPDVVLNTLNNQFNGMYIGNYKVVKEKDKK